MLSALFFASFLYIPVSIAAVEPPPYTPTDVILLNCGSSSTSNAFDGRTWTGDEGSKFSPIGNRNNSSVSEAAEQGPSVDPVPYMTARVSHSEFTYTVPVAAGPKFVRLYFYSATYSGLDKTQSFFSVTANNFTLLSNFSAFLVVEQQEASLIKEFCVTVRDDNMLHITFTPSPTSFAFVNGIEIVSLPNNLYSRGDDVPITLIGSDDNFFFIDNFTALETAYRLNVGGSEIPGIKDTGMFRVWQRDDDYIFGGAVGDRPHREIPILYTPETPAYTAPAAVYTSSRSMAAKFGKVTLNYNLTWTFLVDSGFYYLVRLHFCEILMEVTLPNQRVFRIFIGNQTAENEWDIIRWSHGTGVPVFRDYVVRVPDPEVGPSKTKLWLALHPNMELKPRFADATLNGLEIFKLNKSDGSLAGVNSAGLSPAETNPKLPAKSESKGSPPVFAVVGSVIGGVVGLCLAACFFIVGRRRRRRVRVRKNLTKSSWVPFSYTSRSIHTTTTFSSLPADLCHHFSLKELKAATCNFDVNFIIGAGGFGNVYKGYINGGAATVAIKRLNPSSKQGAHEFQTEIRMLSELRHLHLVSLIGFCDDDDEMILVYDYMAHGTLRSQLYKSTNPPLPWKRRLEICIGAARGLQYLHSGAKHAIIHRDVKSTNILLDEKWVAKVSDFGLSKLGPTGVSQTHVSTAVRGSIGYVDPEYYRRQQLTDKSDVYSFGVVLFEVLCARPALIPDLPREHRSLAELGRIRYQNGTLDQIVDTHLTAAIAPECLRKFGEIAESCVREEGTERPTMSDVVWGLEFALQLQETHERVVGLGVDRAVPHESGSASTDDEDDGHDVFTGSAAHVSNTTVSSVGRSSSSYVSDSLKSATVFSEIMNPTER